MKNYAPDCATLRSNLLENGIKEPMWQGFQWSTKMGGVHIRRDETETFELTIEKETEGYSWMFRRIKYISPVNMESPF